MSNSIPVSDIKTSSDQHVGSAVESAESFVNSVLEFATGDLNLPSIGWDGGDPIDPNAVSSGIVAAINGNTPQDFSIGSIIAERPTTIDVGSIAIPDFGAIPELTTVAPILNLPVTPDRSMPAAPGESPEFNAPALPAAPAVTLPAVPSVENIALPVLPNYSLPTYTPVFPEDDLLAPTATFDFVEQEYTSTLLDSVKAKLLNDLLNGGYGIEPADEQALWEREREREALIGETAIQEATRQVAARGFMVPPGALNAIIESAQQSAMAKMSSVNRDIALKRADLYVANRQFTIAQAKELENMLLTYFGYRMERALNVAKYTAEFGIQVFNALVSRYNARLEAAKVAASVFEVQLRAALSDLEAYKVKLEGAKLSAEVQSLNVELYRAQLDGVQAAVNIYRTQMETAQIQAEMEKLKLEAYRTTVDAYTAQVGARTAEFQMYEAQIRGETAKIDVYRAEVEAYSTKVSAYGNLAQAKKTEVEAQIGVEGLKVDVYRAQLQAYGADLQRAQAEIAARIQKYEVDMRRYALLVDAAKSSATITVDAAKANASVAVQKAQVASQHITNSANVMVNHDSLAANVSAGMFKAYGDRAIAMASQITGIAAEIAS